jgi:hypothetical protein
MYYVWLYDIYRKRNSEKTLEDTGDYGGGEERRASVN